MVSFLSESRSPRKHLDSPRSRESLALTGLALAALIAWLWLATLDGKQLDT